MNAIEVRNLSKQFNNFKLGPLNFDIPQGAIVGFIGENGAGKTTTIKSLLDIIKIDSGEITVLGQQHNTLEASIKAKIGCVILGDEVPENLTAQQIGQVFSRVYYNWDDACFQRALADYALAPNVPVKYFSTGMKMKLNLAIALAHDAELLILDEATSGLDPVARDDFLEHLQTFVLDEKRTVLLSSHILSDLEKICDYYIFIQNGQLVMRESIESLRDNYAIITMTEAAYQAHDKLGIIKTKRNQYNIQLLVDKRQFNYAGECGAIKLDELIYLLSRGEHNVGANT